MTKTEAFDIWNAKVRQAADAWRAEYGRNTLSETGASLHFAVEAHLVFQTMASDVREALDPEESRWLPDEFYRAVEAAL